MMPVVKSFDELAVTPAAEDALGRQRAATGLTGAPMERHSLRAF
jgi:hypothetical protein